MTRVLALFLALGLSAPALADVTVEYTEVLERADATPLPVEELDFVRLLVVDDATGNVALSAEIPPDEAIGRSRMETLAGQLSPGQYSVMGVQVDTDGRASATSNVIGLTVPEPSLTISLVAFEGDCSTPQYPNFTGGAAQPLDRRNGLCIRVDFSDASGVESVVSFVDGAQTYIEENPPYEFLDTLEADFVQLPVGVHELRLEAYDGAGGAGTLLAETTLTVEVIDSTPAPAPNTIESVTLTLSNGTTITIDSEGNVQ